MTPDYWLRAKRALARRDAVLARIIRAHPRIALTRRGEPFKTLARSIVELHGGAIDIETTPGGGAVFHVWVPSERGTSRS